MKKKWMIGGIILGTSLFVIVLSICGGYIWKNSIEAAKRAEDFRECLMSGDLDELRLNFYVEEEQKTVFYNEKTIQITNVSEQELADRFSIELLTLAEEKDWKSAILAEVMKYSDIQVSTGIVITGCTNLHVRLQGPDFQSWLETITLREKKEMEFSQERLLEQIEKGYTSGEIKQRTLQFLIPMRKQNDKWRFAVTQEMEEEFLGGLINLFMSRIM